MLPEPFDLELRFAFGGPLHDVTHHHFVQDARQATLSNKFKLYYRLRPLIPIVIRQLLQRSRNQKMDVGSEWYLHHEFLQDWRNSLRRWLEKSPDQRVVHPWPDGARIAISLTHDVETSQGVKLVTKLADLEEGLGFRSAWNFIPHKYDIDSGLLNDLKARGHEIGVHGYNHDGRLFLSRRMFDRRAEAINDAIQQFGSTGFRAPMVHRNLNWLQALQVDYDASCFDADPFQAMPGGVGSVWPFVAGKFIELPYTLPQDHTLLVALGETSPRIWMDKLERLKQLAGMAMLITHPDYLDSPQRLGVYRQFLEYLAGQTDTWNALPGSIATWWRRRDASSISPDGQLAGPIADRGRSVALSELFHDFLVDADGRGPA